jgi:hypothetical protein
MPGVPGYIWRYAELEAILTEGIRVVALRVEWIADMERRLAVGATIVGHVRRSGVRDGFRVILCGL